MPSRPIMRKPAVPPSGGMAWRLDKFTCRSCLLPAKGWEFRSEQRFNRYAVRGLCEECFSATMMVRRHERLTGDMVSAATHTERIYHDQPRPWLVQPSAAVALLERRPRRSRPIRRHACGTIMTGTECHYCMNRPDDSAFATQRYCDICGPSSPRRATHTKPENGFDLCKAHWTIMSPAIRAEYREVS
jgi:hypothetical protein